ncbi:hypothetical protein BESB_038930 [Besnoitia besnoiti]|uniref:Transmembrane protein n=1 Tax=Besnoitia besnoiti TaxID=94643 RepID=A0A2A9MHJ1_BESBE|nr:hypothetical protein BESB_038930 [Besnoitia besnoiti]PFH37435.1 hypothetical protein BESB_038930 [Besnoitia besnoiti]
MSRAQAALATTMWLFSLLLVIPLLSTAAGTPDGHADLTRITGDSSNTHAPTSPPPPPNPSVTADADQITIEEEPQAIATAGKDVYQFFREGSADYAVTCVTLRDEEKRFKVAQNFCRGFDKNQALQRLCSRVSAELLRTVSSASEGLGPQPFPALFEKMQTLPEHPYFAAGTSEPDLGAITAFVKSTAADPWTPVYEELHGLPTESCPFLQGAHILMTESIQMKAKAKTPVQIEAVKLVAARRTLYSTVFAPVASSMALGLWTELVDFSKCNKASGPKPPGKQSKKEIMYRAFGFAVARMYIPQQTRCSRQSTEPVCQMLISYLAVSQAIVALGRVLGTPSEQKAIGTLDETVAKLRTSITDDEISATQMQVEVSIAETVLIALSGKKKTVKFILAMAKSKKIAKILAVIVAKVKKWVFPFEKQNLETAKALSDARPMVYALENANSAWLGGTGRCAVANKGLENLMLAIARRIAKEMKPTQQTSFLESADFHSPVSGSDSTQITSLIASEEDATGRWVKPHDGLSLLQTPGASDSVGGRGWKKRRKMHFLLAFAGFALATTVIGSFAVPFIHPLFVIFLVTGLFGFILFATFTSVIIKQSLLITATTQASEEIDQTERRIHQHRLEQKELSDAVSEQITRENRNRPPSPPPNPPPNLPPSPPPNPPPSPAPAPNAANTHYPTPLSDKLTVAGPSAGLATGVSSRRPSRRRSRSPSPTGNVNYGFQSDTDSWDSSSGDESDDEGMIG